MRKQILSLCLMLGIALCVSAQEKEIPDSVRLLDNVMKKLEQKSRYIPQLHGIVKFGYEGQYFPNANNNKNSFVFNTVWLGLKGNPFDWFDYNFQFDFANLQVVDLHLNFHPLVGTKAKSSYLNIFLGQAKTPISLDNNYGPANNEAIAYTQVTTALLGYNNKMTPELNQLRYGRDMGLALYGQALKVDWGGSSHDFFDYKIGVYNGNGAGVKALQVDKYMDVSGWLYLHPIKEITLGGSAYYGNYDAQVTDTTTEKAERIRWAGSFRYQDKHWAARTEYIGGQTHGVYSDGWYALLQYTINPGSGNKFWNQWSVVARYDGYRPDYKNAKDNISHNFLVGFNYRPMKYLYIQGQYNYRYTQAGSTNTTNYNMFQLLVGLVI